MNKRARDDSEGKRKASEITGTWYEEVEKRNNELHEQNNEQLRQIQLLNEKNQQLTKEFLKVDNELKKYNGLFESQNDTISKLTEELKTEKNKNLTDKIEWATKYTILENLKKDIAQKKEEGIVQLQKEVAALTEQQKTNLQVNSKLSAEILQLNADNATNKALIVQLEIGNATLLTDIDQLKARNDDLTKSNVQASTDNAGLFAQLNANIKQNATLFAEKDKLLTKLKTSYDAQANRLQVSQAAQTQADVDKKNLSTELQTSNAALQQLKHNYDAQEQNLQDSNAALQQLRTSYDAQEQTLRSSNASQAQQLQVFQTAQAQAAAENKLRLEQLQTSYESQVQTAVAEKDKLLEQLKTSNAAQAQAAAENERLKQEHKKQLADITHTYRTEIELANQTNSQLKADNAEQIRFINESNEQQYNQLLYVNNDQTQTIDNLTYQLSQNTENYQQSLLSQQKENITEYNRLLEEQKAQQDIKHYQKLFY